MINEDILSLNSSAKGCFPSLWNSEKEIEFIFKFSFKNPFAKSDFKNCSFLELKKYGYQTHHGSKPDEDTTIQKRFEDLL